MTLMENFMRWVAGIALILVTLWVTLQGYRILTGQSRESLMATVLRMGHLAVVISAATTMALSGVSLHRWLTTGLDKELHELFTGNRGATTSASIDKSLAYTQIALATINSVKVMPEDTEMQSSRDRSLFIATLGTASPPMTAGAMLLLYQFAIALFIGLGPLFILCLMFDQTKELFRRWLMYGLGTLFSMALLSVVANMALELTIRVSAALWGARFFNHLLGSETEGLSSIAMQQGGIGLLLTALIVSVPPMAAAFFQGTVGNFMSYSAFTGASNEARPYGRSPGSLGPAAGASALFKANYDSEMPAHAYSFRAPDTDNSHSFDQIKRHASNPPK